MAKPSLTKKTIQRKQPASRQKKKPTSSKSAEKDSIISLGPIILLALSVIIVLYARIKLLAIPMERDEAGFAYIGHWIFNGKSLYVDIVDNKLPGLYLLYGLFTNMFGYNSSGVHVGLLFTTVASAVCFYFLSKELFNRSVSAIATGFFIVLITSANVAGFAAHATQLLLPFVLGGWWFFWKGMRSGNKTLFFLAGLLMGIAFIIKQQSIVFGILAALLWWPARIWWGKNEQTKWPLIEWLLLGVGGLLPLALTIGYFSITDRLDDLYFWAYTQPAKLAGSFDTSRWQLFQNMFPQVIRDFSLMWALGALGLFFIWFSGFKKSASLFGVLLFIVGFGSVVIGAAFYKHYFVLALPGIALLAAISINWIAAKTGKSALWTSSILGLVILMWSVIAQRDYFFNPDYAQIHQTAYSQNMFPELERIGTELGKRVAPGERIGIMGSEPGVLVAADREGCSKHLFMYPLLSDPETSPPMQQEYISDLRDCLPEYLVWNTVSGSWAAGYDKLKLFEDLMAWVNENYLTTGIAEFRAGQPGLIVWDGELQTYQSQSEYKVYVFKKK